MIYLMFLFYMSVLEIFFFCLFLYFLINKLVIFIEFEIIKILSVKLELLILLDWISLLFMSVVLFISIMVILYSIEYMSGDININRFMLLVLMFVFSMMLMIVSPNLISILFGWDGLGLVSYCLVIYYQSISSFNSGMVTVLTNRLGDILILMSISLMMSLGSWNFLYLNDLEVDIYILLIIASFTKSAQIPFSSWLPMAMAAPTPVSSLVHSSTLVTAGVYLLIRLNYLLLFNNKIILLVSIMTMFLSGLGANFEFDLKKIIALSTLSQLGVMIFCLSMNLEKISFFHLVIHAMFKSLLFMCAGVIIHNMMGNQDIRYISMVLYNLPMISIMFNCSSLSLCGIPFLSGFFSKDLILEMFLMNKFNKFILSLLFISMGLTISYTIRLVYFSFIKIPQLIYYCNYSSFNSMMGISMYLLFFFSIIMGLILSWLLFSMKNMIFLSKKFKLMIYYFMIMGFILGNYLFSMMINKILFFYCNFIIKFFSMLWFMSMLYNWWVPKFLKFSNQLNYMSDMGWIYYMMMIFNKYIINWIKIEFFFKNYYYLLIFYMIFIIIIIY